MKNICNSLFRSITTRFMLSFAAILLATVFAGATPANEQPKPAPVLVKYLGTINDFPVILVEFENEEEEEISVILKSNEGAVIYSERFKEKKFSKKFQVSRAYADDSITLVLGFKKEKPQVFQINRNVRVVEDVTVLQVR